jgi:hypothetical protein
MKLLPILLEYIHDDADLIVYENINDVEVEVWNSPHTEELRDGKRRITDRRIFLNLVKNSLPYIVDKYFKSGVKYRLIDKNDPQKISFAVRQIKGQSRPQLLLQVEELTEDKIVLNVITFLDSGSDIYNINNKNSIRFILDMGEKDLVNK